MVGRQRRAISVRALLLLLVAVGSAYVIGLTAYLTALQLSTSRSELRYDPEPTLRLFDQLTHRAAGLAALTTEARRLPTLPRDQQPEAARRLRAAVVETFAQPAPDLYAGVPYASRIRLLEADARMSRLETVLVEVAALTEVGRATAADPYLAAADSLTGEVTAGLMAAHQLNVADLIRRERALKRVAREGYQALLAWLVVGIIGLPLAILVVRRRLGKPLASLEEGLTRVAEGDLSVHLPVRHLDEVGRLTEHFNDMTRVLRERAEEQGRFIAAGQLIAGVAHEVNNPLMAITAMAQIRLGKPDLDPEVRDDLQQIARQARRAGKLVSGLLRFVQARDRHSRLLDVAPVVRQAVDLVSYQFAVSEITFEAELTEPLPPVLADAARLEQVFVNLLSNAVDAVRQVPPPRRLGVRSHVGKGRLLIECWDNGPGIPPELRRRLFRPFFTTKGRRGTGLGLYISRQIVREFGGDLFTADREGGGATFVVALPAAAAGEATAAPADPPDDRDVAATPLSGVTVLVVDDEDAVRRPIAAFLERRGAVVRTAVNGRDAMDQLAREPVDVVLADIRMPVMTGVEMLGALRTSNPGAAERLLFLSGDLTSLAASGLPVPRDRILLKPIDLVEIERRILELFELDRGRAAMAVGAPLTPAPS